MAKLQENRNNKTGKGYYFIVIPVDIVKANGFRKGDVFGVMLTTGGDLLLRPVRK